jgi:hypothetical protein
VAHVSSGDSDSDQEQETLEFGTNFTVDLRNIELTGEQRDAVSSEIIRVIIELIEIPEDAEGVIEVVEGFWKKKKFPGWWQPDPFPRYM